MRVARRWNQTGQKHAGEPDIARGILSNHIFMLWLLVLSTYSYVAWRLSKCSLPVISDRTSSAIYVTLCFAALRFKITFATVDTPELLTGFPQIFTRLAGNVSLVVHCKIIFLSIGTIVFGLLLSKAYYRLLSKENNSGKAKFEKRAVLF